MSTLSQRASKLEQNVQPQERRFVGWGANPWTPEQMAEANRRHPDKRLFWRSLVETPEDTGRKLANSSAEL